MPTEDEEIGAFVADALARRKAGERAQRDDRATRSSMPGFMATAAQGLTFGFGDELTAGARSLFGRTPYDTALAEERAGLEKYREDHPMMAMGAELAGSLPTALIPGLGAARMAQGAAQVAQGANRFATAMRAGAAGGAAQGTLQGFGEGEGGAVNRAGSAVAGGAIGGAVGSVAGPLAELATAGGRAIRDRVIEPLLSPQKAAERRLATAVERDSGGPVNPSQAVQDSATDRAERARRGLPDTGETLAEVAGPNARGTMEALAAQPGQAMADTARQLEARGAGRGGRLVQGLRAIFGQEDEAFGARMRLYEERSRAGGPAYQAAFDSAAPLGEAEIKLLGRVPASALRDAAERARLRGEPFGLAEGAAPTARDLHVIKSGLDTMIEANTDIAGRLNGRAVDARGLRQEIVQALDNLTPDGQGGSLYASARRQWADPSANLDAQALGARAFSMNPAEVRAAVAQMGDAERDYFIQGGMNRLMDDIAKVKTTGTANPVNAVAGSPLQRQRLEVLVEAMGLPPAEAASRVQALTRFFTAETAGSTAEGNVLRNSRTAVRQAFARDLVGGGVGAVAGGGLSNYMGGDVTAGALAGAGLGTGSRYVMRSAREAADDRLGQMLGQTNPDRQREIMARIQALRAQAAREAAGANTRAAYRAGGMLGTSNPTDGPRRGLLD